MKNKQCVGEFNGRRLYNELVRLQTQAVGSTSASRAISTLTELLVFVFKGEQGI